MTLFDVLAEKFISFHEQVVKRRRSDMMFQDTLDSIFDPQRLRDRRIAEAIGFPILFLLWCIPWKKRKKKEEN